MSYRDESERMAHDLDRAERDAERFYSAAEGLSKELDRRTAELEERIAEAITFAARRCAEIADKAASDEFGFPQGLPGDAIRREFGLGE